MAIVIEIGPHERINELASRMVDVANIQQSEIVCYVHGLWLSAFPAETKREVCERYIDLVEEELKVLDHVTDKPTEDIYNMWEVAKFATVLGLFLGVIFLSSLSWSISPLLAILVFGLGFIATGYSIRRFRVRLLEGYKY